MPTLADLTPDPRNARRHTPRNLAMIEDSIQRDGFGRSILTANDGTIIAGNATVEAAMSAGLVKVRVVESTGDEVIDVRRVDVEPGSKTFHDLAVGDNRSGELADGWIGPVLKQLNDDGLIDRAAHWHDDEWQETLARFAEEDAPRLTDPDAVPEVPKEATTRPGDVWVLGRHRLMCGDATDVGHVRQLVEWGDKVDMVYTDPPYGIDVVASTVGGSKPFGASDGGAGVVKANLYQPIVGDGTTETARDAYALAVTVADKILFWGGNYFTDFLPPSRCWIVWDKKGRDWDDNFSDFEMAWTNLDKPSKIMRHTWMGMVQSGEREKRVHPTQKPVQLAIDLLDYLGAGNVVLDLFGGSGSTLMACESSGRQCAVMEISPAYCDVIVQRFTEATGQRAVLATAHAEAAD